jgi:hypothetical protein
MKNLIHTAVVTLFAASAAQVQQAVQWKVSDGGNGHWYAFNASLTSWHDARSIALGRGGDLASLSSTLEREFWMSRVPIGAGAPGCAGCTWLGGFQDRSAPEYSEPGGGWRWSDGTAWNYTFWNPGEPNDLNGSDYLYGSGPTNGRWDDSSGSCCAASVIEWSADCNGDGIVDYGQCHDGTLPDYNINNTPDCCERGEVCVVGNYPVQWRVEDGGNGHWYQFVPNFSITWETARIAASARGGHLATLTSPAENALAFDLVAQSAQAWSAQIWGPFLGATRRNLPGWQWVTGEEFQFVAWGPGEPNNGSGGSGPEDRLAMLNHPSAPATWNDVTDSGCAGSNCEARTSSGSLIEWSIDCNSDGVVDYGQILQGQLVDANTNGVPDICEGPTCNDIDLNLNGIVDGGDLGILLAFWGTVSPAFPRADINRDGLVNGADLGILLAFWGPCPN